MKPLPQRLGSHHTRVLDVLSRLAIATVNQVNTALYQKGSLTTTRELLLDLYRQGYLDRLPYRRFDFGNPGYVYKITGRGAKHLRNRLTAGKTIITASRNYTRSQAQLDHLVKANQLLVDALAIAREVPDISAEIESEPFLRRNPIQRSSLTVIPDGWLRLRKIRQFDYGELVVCFEYTTGSQWKDQLIEKVKAYIDLDGSEEYEKRFGTDGLLVCFVTPSTPAAEELKKLIIDYLTLSLQTDKFDLFAVAPYQEDFYRTSGLIPKEWL